MTDKKKELREFWIIQLGDFIPPGVMKSKEAADAVIEITKRGNDPKEIHVREVNPALDEAYREMERQLELVNVWLSQKAIYEIEPGSKRRIHEIMGITEVLEKLREARK